VPSGTPIGTVAGAVADRLGLGRGVLVVTGGFDQAMATLGAGVTEAGTAHLGMGSYEALTAPLDRPRTEEHLRAGGWSVGRTAAGTNRWSTMSSWLGGAALDWLARSVRGGGGTAGPTPARLLREATSGPARILALAGLEAGDATFVGLDLGTARGDLAAALLEAVCLDLRRALADLRRAGITVDSLRATGGGARSRRWLQLTADVTRLPVERVRVRDAGAFAAGLMAGAAAGMLPPADVAVRDLVRIDRRAEPRPELGDHYARRAELHAELGVAIRRPSSVAAG
jgi:xylulokinase